MLYSLVIVVGLIGGIAVGLQSPIAGLMGQKIGGVASSFVVHLGGLILSGLLLIIYRGQNINSWHALPWYMLGVGAFGIILFLSVTFTLPRLGAAMMITLIVVGQLGVGIVIDHFGLFGTSIHQFSIVRLAGVVALLLGSYLISV